MDETTLVKQISSPLANILWPYYNGGGFGRDGDRKAQRKEKADMHEIYEHLTHAKANYIYCAPDRDPSHGGHTLVFDPPEPGAIWKYVHVWAAVWDHQNSQKERHRTCLPCGRGQSLQLCSTTLDYGKQQRLFMVYYICRSCCASANKQQQQQQ